MKDHMKMGNRVEDVRSEHSPGEQGRHTQQGRMNTMETTPQGLQKYGR